ncbi:MAG: sn-glycerol-1-phosphate dehydrogenase [Atribacterota bacterium]
MNNSPFLQIEGKSLPCSCGCTHHIHTEKTLLGNEVLPQIPRILREMGFRKTLMVFDENTYQAAGIYVEEELKRGNFEVIPCLLPKKKELFYLEPDEEARGQIGEHLRQEPEVLVAVGSGVINDLVKFVAHRVGLPFVVVATAPSMDGYSSPGAPMMVSGYKVTYSATPPRVIFADLAILSQAPMPLIHAGLLDLLGKAIANADWVMRRLLFQEDFCEAIWETTRENLLRVAEKAEKLSQRDYQAIYELSLALLHSGFSMDMIGDSRPASGAEHLIAHYLEIMALHRGMNPSLHGLRVGTATALMHRIYTRFLQEMPTFSWNQKPNFQEKMEILKMSFGPLFPLVAETARKKLTITVPERLKEKSFQATFSAAIEEKLSVLPDPQTVLQKAQAPQSLEALGFPHHMVREALLLSRFLRERATILDLLDQMGMLEEYVDWVFQEP